MDLDTWVSLAGLFVAFLTFYGAFARSAAKDRTQILTAVRDVRDEASANHKTALAAIKDVRDEANANHRTALAAIKDVRNEANANHKTALAAVRELRSELVTKIDQNHAETIGRLSMLEQRTYDMATRMVPASPERHTG